MFLEFGGGTLHNMSYQLAMDFTLPISGVVLISPGYCFRRAGIVQKAVIEKIGSTEIHNIEQMIALLSETKCGAILPVKFFYLSEKNAKHVVLVEADFKWFLFQRWDRDIHGIWKISSLSYPKESHQLTGISTTIPQVSNPLSAKFAPSFVMVRFATPYQLNGLTVGSFVGTGVILDSLRGIVLVDKCTVPYSLGDITVIIAGSIEIRGSVLIEHPLHGFTLIRYDPEQLGTTPLKAIEFSDTPLQVGDHCSFVGLNGAGNIITFSSDVTQIEPIRIPVAPRYRETNMMRIYLGNDVRNIGGVLCGVDGKVQALWLIFAVGKADETKEASIGISIDTVVDCLTRVQSCLDEGKEFSVQSLELELFPVPIFQARHHGLSPEWADKLQEHDNNRQVLQILRSVAGSPASKVFQEGDLLLALNRQVISRFREVEMISQDLEEVNVTIWRNNSEISFDVKTVQLTGCVLKWLLLWSGAFIQESFRDLMLLKQKIPSGVYIGRFFCGSPAESYNLKAKIWITEVNGKKTPNLKSFLEAIQEHPVSSFIRLKTVDFANKKNLITLLPNTAYWPTVLFTSHANSWSSQVVQRSDFITNNPNAETEPPTDIL